MKLSSVNNTLIVNNSYTDRNKQQKQQSFKGIGDSLVNFWQFVDNGGRALQFTVEDMCGTNLPRTYKGAKAGYKYTGKINVPAMLQEAIREFLTGPTMCIMPILILNTACKLAGKTANTHVENINNLTHLASKQIKESQGFDEAKFFKTVMQDMLNVSTGKEIDSSVADELATMVAQYKQLTSNNVANPKASKEKAQELLSALQTRFQLILKENLPSYNGHDFLEARYTISDAQGIVKEGGTKFKNYINYAVEYARDYASQAKKTPNFNLTAFKNTWIGRRLVTIASMIVITGLAMSFIPKLYTIASGKINPNATVIYDEAKKKDTPNGKEAK